MDTEIKIPNAQKWTEEEVMTRLSQIYHLIYSIDNIYYIGEALTCAKLYPDIWAYWKRKFAGHEDIMEKIKEIENVFEARIVNGALEKKVSTSMAIFVLRCKYGWKDKTAEPAKPKETGEPVEQAPDTAPEAAPQATTDAGADTTDGMGRDLGQIHPLQYPEYIGGQFQAIRPLCIKVEGLLAER